MKKSLILFVFLLGMLSTYAQVPQSFSYQAVARDNQNNCLSNTLINIQISILNNSTSGTVIYRERHENIQTNAVGHFQINIGKGIPQVGPQVLAFSDINWSADSRFVKVEIAPGNSNTYSEIGTSQFLSVPFAMYAQNKPTYDSGWITMQSQAGNNSYKEFAHNLNAYPSNVKVLVRATSGNNQGFIFEGMGSAQSDDDNDEYGGVIFAYNQNTVRLWAPTVANNNPKGSIIMVGDGWGNEINSQFSASAEVRVLVWK
ncbi:MAG: hypothetical protein R3C61_18790 [Bacteroidia bacterium]